MMENLMKIALSQLSSLVKASFPGALRTTLLEYGMELDRLRAELNELRSTIEKGE